MYPVVIGNGRSTTSDIVISGYRVPKGVKAKTLVNLNLTVINQYNAIDVNNNLNKNY